MKKLKEVVSHFSKTPNAIASLALVFAVVAANSPCFCIYHETEKPDMKKMRKF